VASVDHNIIGMGALGRALRPLVPETSKVVFFCVKAFDLKQALIEQHQKWPMDIPFITLCNGYIYQIVSSLETQLAGRTVRLGMTTMGATLMQNGDVRVFRDGALTCWGPKPDETDDRLRPTKDEKDLIKSNQGWSWYDDMSSVLQKKWVFNATLNTLSAALELSRNGLLHDHVETAESVLQESMELSEKLWSIRLAQEVKSTWHDDFWGLVSKTSQNENSMARDVRLGRPTESEYLAGMASRYDGFPYLKKYHEQITNMRFHKDEV
jgi:ketopantoate reductase